MRREKHENDGSHLKMDGWNTIIRLFPLGNIFFNGELKPPTVVSYMISSNYSDVTRFFGPQKVAEERNSPYFREIYVGEIL